MEPYEVRIDDPATGPMTVSVWDTYDEAYEAAKDESIGDHAWVAQRGFYLIGFYDGSEEWEVSN
jgi:hypothetical protein